LRFISHHIPNALIILGWIIWILAEIIGGKFKRIQPVLSLLLFLIALRMGIYNIAVSANLS